MLWAYAVYARSVACLSRQAVLIKPHLPITPNRFCLTQSIELTQGSDQNRNAQSIWLHIDSVNNCLIKAWNISSRHIYEPNVEGMGSMQNIFSRIQTNKFLNLACNKLHTVRAQCWTRSADKHDLPSFASCLRWLNNGFGICVPNSC